MRKFYCIIVICLSLCLIISCGGDTDTNDGDVVIGSVVLNGIFTEVISVDNDYLIAVVTEGDDNFSQDDQVTIYCREDLIPCVEAIQVGDTIDVEYFDTDFSKTDGAFSIDAYVVGMVLDQDGDVVIIDLLNEIEAEAEVESIYNDYLIAIVTEGDDNFSQDDQVNIYYSEDSMPDIEVGDTIVVSYCVNDFSETDGVFSINAFAIGTVLDQ